MFIPKLRPSESSSTPAISECVRKTHRVGELMMNELYLTSRTIVFARVKKIYCCMPCLELEGENLQMLIGVAFPNATMKQVKVIKSHAKKMR